MIGPQTDTNSSQDRGQAYTLEGFISAMVVLMAVLFALQSVVITPTTGGAADRAVQEQIQQETQDALLVASQEGNLSEMVRHWEIDEEGDATGEFDGAEQHGPGEYDTYATDVFNESFVLGSVLDERFGNDGMSYNVELHYTNATANDSSPRYLVYQGSPPSSAVTASQTVTLYDNQTTNTSGDRLVEVGGDQPIPELADEEYLYNVVEVRVIVW